MKDIVIQVHNLSKRYHIGGNRKKYHTISESLQETLTAPFRKASRLLRGHASAAGSLDHAIWALKDVSFEVERGDAVAIIGRNGAGKTTLLKLLSRITDPTNGRIAIRGRVGTLLEVGTGFHPELTGRENIFLNGAVLGMTKQRIKKHFDEIVAFAETEAFLDTPVKHYSTGMHVRLAFAVAAHLNPEILVVDEVLAVGDAPFQTKCLAKMADVARSGRTVLFVSHNLVPISVLCPKAILLEEGRLVYSGKTSTVIPKYLDSLSSERSISLADRNDRQGDGRIRFTKLTLLNSAGTLVPAAVSGQPLTILLNYNTSNGSPARNVDVDIGFFGPIGQLLFYCKAKLAHGNFDTLPPGAQIACHIPSFPLSPGRYRIKLWSESNRVTADRIDDAATLTVKRGDFYGSGHLPIRNPKGAVMVKHSWDLLSSSK